MPAEVGVYGKGKARMLNRESVSSEGTTSKGTKSVSRWTESRRTSTLLTSLSETSPTSLSRTSTTSATSPTTIATTQSIAITQTSATTSHMTSHMTTSQTVTQTVRSSSPEGDGRVVAARKISLGTSKETSFGEISLSAQTLTSTIGQLPERIDMKKLVRRKSSKGKPAKRKSSSGSQKSLRRKSSGQEHDVPRSRRPTEVKEPVLPKPNIVITAESVILKPQLSARHIKLDKIVRDHFVGEGQLVGNLKMMALGFECEMYSRLRKEKYWPIIRVLFRYIPNLRVLHEHGYLPKLGRVLSVKASTNKEEVLERTSHLVDTMADYGERKMPLAYAKYCANLPRAKQLLQHMLLADSRFAFIIQICKDKTGPNLYDLQTLLEAPVTRALNYTDTFQEILDHVEEVKLKKKVEVALDYVKVGFSCYHKHNLQRH